MHDCVGQKSKVKSFFNKLHERNVLPECSVQMKHKVYPALKTIGVTCTRMTILRTLGRIFCTIKNDEK